QAHQRDAGFRRRRLVSGEIAPERMAALPERLARAGASAEIMDRRALAALGASADLALIDAPCSGSGAWARRPDAKWRLTPERLQALRAAQGEALRLGAASVRKGGALVYVTCSLFHSENHGAVAAFLAERPGFAPLALSPLWRRAGLAPEHAPPPRGGDPLEAASLQLSPALHGTDGFHLCALRRVLD
ncbi:MAG: MFS transporter, partial [Pseudomonadota bacterium]